MFTIQMPAVSPRPKSCWITRRTGESCPRIARLSKRPKRYMAKMAPTPLCVFDSIFPRMKVPREAFAKPLYGSTGKSGSWFLHESLMWRVQGAGGMRRVVCETPSGLEASLVSPVNFLAENGVLFVRHLIDSYGVNLRLPRVRKLFSGLFAPVFRFLPVACVPASFLDARVTRMGQ